MITNICYIAASPVEERKAFFWYSLDLFDKQNEKETSKRYQDVTEIFRLSFNLSFILPHFFFVTAKQVV